MIRHLSSEIDSIMKKKFTLLLILTFLISSAYSDVFTLWPFSRGNSGSNSTGDITEVLNAAPLWSEPVIINGAQTSFGIGVLKTNLRQCLFQLKSFYPKALISQNASSALLELKTGKTRRRIYLVQLGGLFPVIQFSMDLPEEIPKKFTWPSDNLPLPPSTTPLTYMHYPNRKSFYGNFVSQMPVMQTEEEMRRELIGKGWKSFRGTSPTSTGKGEVFIKENPLSIMVVGISENKNGQVHGSMYTRPLKKK